jgi:hypothetical protein
MVEGREDKEKATNGDPLVAAEGSCRRNGYMPAPPDEGVIRMRAIAVSPGEERVCETSAAMDLCDMNGDLEVSGNELPRQRRMLKLAALMRVLVDRSQSEVSSGMIVGNIVVTMQARSLDDRFELLYS